MITTDIDASCTTKAKMSLTIGLIGNPHKTPLKDIPKEKDLLLAEVDQEVQNLPQMGQKVQVLRPVTSRVNNQEDTIGPLTKIVREKERMYHKIGLIMMLMIVTQRLIPKEEVMQQQNQTIKDQEVLPRVKKERKLIAIIETALMTNQTIGQE